MDHIEAQSLISEALDREPVDAASLERAKQHCRECAECAAFVRALTAVKRSPLPQPPADLADRVIATVRAEAEAQSGRLAAEASAAAAVADDLGTGPVAIAETPVASDPIDADKLVKLVELDAAARRRRQRTTLVALGMSAAVILIAGGMLAVGGIRQMSSAPETTKSLTARLENKPAEDSQQSAGAAAGAGAGAASPAAPAAAEGGPSYVSFQGLAWVLDESAPSAPAQRTQVGTIETRLNGTTPKTRAVFSAAGSENIYLQDDAGAFLTFRPITRQFSTTTYRLTSGDITEFGVWPGLPSQIAEPADPNGSPTFTYVTQDSGGVKIYRLAGGTGSEGIAIGPDTPSSDPAAGNPEWTWWTPQR